MAKPHARLSITAKSILICCDNHVHVLIMVFFLLGYLLFSFSATASLLFSMTVFSSLLRFVLNFLSTYVDKHDYFQRQHSNIFLSIPTTLIIFICLIFYKRIISWKTSLTIDTIEFGVLQGQYDFIELHI